MSLLGPQLEAFIAVTKHKSVHHAAQEIHLTQTAVTQRIRALERILRTTLFIRTRRGMILTREGEALLHYCQAAKELEGLALAKIDGAGVETEIEIRISAPTSITRSRIIPNCLPIMRSFSKLLIRFDVNDVEHRHLLLRAGESDFVIIQEKDLASEMKFKQLAPERYVLVCSSNWKKRKLRDIVAVERIIDFDPTDQITYDYLREYELLDNVQYSRYFVNRTDNLALLVSEGIGYTTLTKEFAQPFIDNGELMVLNRGKTYDLHPYLAWYDRPEPPKYFSAIINSIR